ncbi:MAG: hydrogenase [Aminobacterium sp.]|jgi:hypothetical protein|nr:hydrogenase [Aminobacterium sp.]MDD3426127.1 hydrogenase [Aminobacterium sp.]MDD3707286.1 hydrogenase [Aminobacterium sp.]MDD4228548.1 hydrogenase [Aminobacterium sp.]MDD4551476.1 hydrogenase [Aminobacterium sp.]
MWNKVFTGFGYWDVISWLIFFFIASFFALWLRSIGRRDYKEGTEQDEIYWSGNPVPEDGAEISVPASSSYWGFRKALEPYYKVLVAMHSGHIRDYVGYYVVTAALIAALILVV